MKYIWDFAKTGLSNVRKLTGVCATTAQRK